MQRVSLTLTFDSLEAVSQFLDKRPDPRQATINFADRPDTGVSFDEKAALLSPAGNKVFFVEPTFNPFAGAAAVPAAPTPEWSNHPMQTWQDAAAPSIAAAAVPPTAPAVPTPTSATPSTLIPPAPPTASVVPAPVAPAAPANLAGIAVDADGLPWDARIHAGGRATNADGKWRQKRGLNDPALKARVEAELRQAMGAPAASVPVVPTAPAPVPPTTAAVPAPPVALTSPPVSPDAAATPTGETFQTFMARCGGLLVSGALTQEKLNAVAIEVGLPGITLLHTRPDLVPAVAARVNALVAA
jgi:hypothetical protein